MRVLWAKCKESMMAVFPITAIILIVGFAVAPSPGINLGAFFLGALLLLLGMVLYTLGSEVALEPMGRMIGSGVTKTGKLSLILVTAFIIGIVVTVAEPDLTVLAERIAAIPSWALIGTISLGVGVFLTLALLRVFTKIPLHFILLGSYGLIFLLAAFSDISLVPLAFDSGGVTTGPITVPFFMAIGVGVTSKLSGKHGEDNAFGVIAMCSVGPILSVLVLGLIMRPEVVAIAPVMPTYGSVSEMFGAFGTQLLKSFGEVAISLAPILIFFLIYELIFEKLSWTKLSRVLIGVLYAYVGLSLFLCGVNVGYLPMGAHIGAALGSATYNWILVPIGMLVGAFIVLAEPAVHVLKHQVSDITNGTIKSGVLLLAMACSIAIAVGLAMLRILFGIPIWYILVPGYIVCLTLPFFIPKIFTAIAFDSGSVASGPMTAAFLLPFALGACSGVGGNLMTDAFGTIAFISMMPIVTIGIFGLVYRIRNDMAVKHAMAVRARATGEFEIIELAWQEEPPAKKIGRKGAKGKAVAPTKLAKISADSAMPRQKKNSKNKTMIDKEMPNRGK